MKNNILHTVAFLLLFCAPCFAQSQSSVILNGEKRLCSHRGMNKILPENSLPAWGAAVALGASEIEFDLWWTQDGEIVSIHDKKLDRVSDGEGLVFDYTYEELLEYDFGIKKNPHCKGMRIAKFEEILRQFAGRTIMNIHLKGLGSKPWDEATLNKIICLIDKYNCRSSVYFMTNNGILQEQLARLAPDIVRCMGDQKDKDIVARAVKYGCKIVQIRKENIQQATFDRAREAGLRINVFFADDPIEAKKYLDMGADTILTNDYQVISDATGLK